MEDKRKTVLGFVKDFVNRKDFNIEMLMDMLPEDRLLKLINDDKKDTILECVISSSQNLQILLNNLGLSNWKGRQVEEVREMKVEYFKWDFGRNQI